MLKDLQTLASAAAMQRATLLVNHVLASEPVAQQRLRTHAGCCIRFQYQQWPTLLPQPPESAFRITPAGLLEWCGGALPATPDLEVHVDMSNPALLVARALAGERPKVEVYGNAALAADVNWLAENLRWDLQDDLARIVGEGPAAVISRIGQGFATALREGVRLAGSVGERFGRPRGGDDAGTPPR